MLSAFILSVLSYPAVPLARQLVHQRNVLPNPLVLKKNPRKFRTPTADRDRPVSRRSEPSSRTTFIGEQPNPWRASPPQDVMSRHRVPNRSPLWTLEAISLLSPEYLLSDEHGPSIQNHRITKSYFRICSTYESRSQAPFYLWLNA